ncbi:MAG TPA: hypothetical protein VHA35_03820 [Dongiaceae bacterium]|jgi:hypothetical protein|nr:hypothetical protein [Dongiaceae bacterium]
MQTKAAADLASLLEKAKNVQMTPADKEAQRRSFAYGNANIENERVTKETVDKEAERLGNTASDKR